MRLPPTGHNSTELVIHARVVVSGDAVIESVSCQSIIECVPHEVHGTGRGYGTARRVGAVLNARLGIWRSLIECATDGTNFAWPGLD